MLLYDRVASLGMVVGESPESRWEFDYGLSILKMSCSCLVNMSLKYRKPSTTKPVRTVFEALVWPFGFLK